jgi:hypothetical protein
VEEYYQVGSLILSCDRFAVELTLENPQYLIRCRTPRRWDGVVLYLQVGCSRMDEIGCGSRSPRQNQSQLYSSVGLSEDLGGSRRVSLTLRACWLRSSIVQRCDSE